MSVRFEMRVPEAWLAAVDGGRGQVSRAAFVKAAVEQALAASGAGPMAAAPAGLAATQAASNAVKERQIAAVPASRRAEPPTRQLFRCPHEGCSWTSTDWSKCCLDHGRRGVRVGG